MRHFFVSLFASVFFFASAHAGEPRILQVGDVIPVEEGEALSVAELRDLLRDWGYSRFGIGGKFGRTLILSAMAPNKQRYEMRVHSQTGEVLRVMLTR